MHVLYTQTNKTQKSKIKHYFVRWAVYRIYWAKYSLLLGPLPNMAGHFNIHSSIKSPLGVFPTPTKLGVVGEGPVSLNKS